MPETKAHPNLSPDYARECAMTPVRTLGERIVAREAEKRGLTFPLTGLDNRPIYDAAGKLVSVPENAPLFVAAANLVHEISEFGLSGEVDGEITCEQAVDHVVRWIERARKIVGEQK